jgi:hypothetical protein
MTLKIEVLTWERHKNVTEFNRLMESQPSPLDNIDIKSFFHTVKPVLRGHLWDK